MLWKVKMQCQCDQAPDLLNISDWHGEFCQSKVASGESDKHQLFDCSSCSQLWLVDKKDLRNIAYAYKIDEQKDWQHFDTAHLVKAQMLKNREGYSEEPCKLSDCIDNAINGSRYCVDHLYQSGARL